MVQLNFTLVVEMVLFWVFYGVTKRFFFRPVLRTMDAREGKVREDHEAAEETAEAAAALETQYSDTRAEAHHDATHRVRISHNEALEKSLDGLQALRADKDAELDAYRDSLQKHLEGERRQYAGLAPGLVETMDQWVHSGETGP